MARVCALKKEESTMCAKVLTGVLCERLKLLVKTLIGPYQSGFRFDKSTIDQILTLRQILKKTHEKQVYTHYKAAFDSSISDRTFVAMSALTCGIPVKLIRLCRMTLSNFSNAVKVGMNLSESFDTGRFQTRRSLIMRPLQLCHGG